MALKSMVMEFGMGTDVLGRDWTKAAVRALHNTLRQNSISFADAFDLPRTAMQVKIVIGAGQPEQVDRAAVAAVLPYGQAEVEVVQGGLEVPRDGGKDPMLVANAALTVFLDLPEEGTPQ
ncbi:MAG: Lin0512 family protein [Pseudomonadota bacterium]